MIIDGDEEESDRDNKQARPFEFSLFCPRRPYYY
jgi:hypothetical protein